MAAIMSVDFENCFILTFLCFFSFLSYSFIFKKPKNSRRGRDLPPSPPSLPIVGHLHLLLSTLIHKSLQKISSKYGPLLHLRFFHVPIILVSSASMAHEIFKSHDVNISYRGVSANGESLVFGSSGFLSAPYGDYLKFMKKLAVTKFLRPQAIEQAQGVRAVELERFYANLMEKAKKKESVEIAMEVMKLTNNMIFRMIMGRRYSEARGYAERVMELTIKSFNLTKKIFFANMLRSMFEKLGISLFNKEIMGVSREYDELLERILVEHEETLEEEDQDKDMMDFLLETYRDEKAEYKITRNHIKSLFVEIFLGGTDPSTRATEWTMAEILNNPNILEKMREEIDTVVGKARLIQESDLPNLPYLQAVVKEGLRMYPPLPLVLRAFQESCEIKGFYVPKETVLVVNAYGVMRDPDSWEDPDVFKPERFLDFSRSGQEEQGMKYIPFGAGRRGCLGSHLAYIVQGTTIGTMVQCFDWRIKGDKINMEETLAGLVLTMAHPLKCTPVPRLGPFGF
ncbi:unnamed protein product [Microthlaspi erraticum]|uniref:Uncharacterized protein n=1 Tax=Microthlaspi erraticum TaxID=1685480 RepID=A0A6D2HIP5_9BRAS|nr:unnamed protein product [Microthlaspi erraticum]